MAEYTEVFPFYLSAVIDADITTDDWSQSLTLTQADAPAGFYFINVGFAYEMPALSYQLEFRTSGGITRGPYTLVGGGVPALIPELIGTPLQHNGGELTLTFEARIPALGFNVMLSDLYISAMRVS